MGIRSQIQPLKVDPLDLRPITRDSKIALTQIRLFDPYTMRHVDWITMGASYLHKEERFHRWRLEARLPNATDFEHDSAYAIRMSLVGLTFDGMFFQQQPMFVAWIDGSDVDSFNVPESDYNPLTLKGTQPCRECKGKDKHVIVPEGYFVPPPNKPLFEKVRGLKVEVTLSFGGKCDDED